MVVDDGLTLKDVPILKLRLGVNPNDLTRDTLLDALDNLAWNGKECSILDAFKYVSMLYFWHS